MSNARAHDPYEIRTGSGPTTAGSGAASAAEISAETTAGSVAGPPDPVAEPAYETGAPARTGSNPTSVLLWTLAAILAGTNTALSIAGMEIIGSIAGAGALVCLTILLVRYLRRRR